MAAPTSNITWGNTVTGSKSTRKGKIGIYTGITETNTQVKATVQVWFWSMYSVDDTNNTYTYNGENQGSKTIKHTVDSGEGWSTSNQTKLGEYSYTYDKGTSNSTKTYSAKFTGLETFGTSSVMSASRSITVAKKTSYTVTYNANGGTGAPSSQTKWQDTSITLSTTKPTRSGYTFLGWATSSTATSANGSYDPGDTYSSNANLTLYAVWKANTYTVTYNANGGTGAPSSQTKTYGASLTLSSTKPTRTNYTFKGWGLSSNATTVAYSPGASYTTDANLTLYAIWSLSYIKPRVTNVQCERCNSDGILNEEGTYGLVTFDWASDTGAPSIIVKYKETESNSWKSTTGSVSGFSGSYRKIISGPLNIEQSYDISIIVIDSGDPNGTSVLDSISSMIFYMDCLPDNKGIAFGKTAELEGVADFGYEAKFNKPVYGKALGMDALPAIPTGTNTDNLRETGCYTVRTDSDASTMTNLPVKVAGRFEVWASLGDGTNSSSWSYIRQRFVPFSLNYGLWERDIWRDSNNVWKTYSWKLTSSANMVVYNGSSNGSIDLGVDLQYFEYMEIFYTDNNGNVGGYTKIHTPYNKPIHLSIIEPATSTATYIRKTSYTISGSTLTPNTTTAGYVSLIDGSTVSHKDSTINRIKITRVVLHHA